MTHIHLEVEGVNVAWPNAGALFEPMSATYRPAESSCFLRLQGPSGCGKTSLLYALAGLKQPLSGRIEWQIGTRTYRFERGESWAQAAASFRRDVAAFCFQAPKLLSYLTVGQAYRFGLAAERGKRGGAEGRVVWWKQLFAGKGLSSIERGLPQEKSGGERQRLALGLALDSSPRIRFVDEPLSNLDDESKKRVLAALSDWVEQADGVIVSVLHDADRALAEAELEDFARGMKWQFSGRRESDGDELSYRVEVR